jgi:tetratricopeptide (TPR) repeat protein/transcriptional regulator with XRE-family HTH domain
MLIRACSHQPPIVSIDFTFRSEPEGVDVPAADGDPPVTGHPAGPLRGWRERSGLTQEQLAHRAGVSVRTIRRLESGRPRARSHSSSLLLVADALGLSPAEREQLASGARGVRRPETGPLRQLPASPPGFTGRSDELAALELLDDPNAMVVVAIDGMAGVGKTALAVHAAHRAVSRFPHGQIFIDLHGHTAGLPPVDPSDALNRMLHALGVPGAEVPATLDERAALYRSRMAHRRILVLLDNADDEKQVTPLLPGTPGCMVLVTSRRRLPGLDATHVLSLDVLPRRDAVDLFARTAGEQRVSIEPPAVMAEVVEQCGRLPLAVRIAAARLRTRPAWTAAHLVERLRDHRSRLAELEAGERSVTAALDLSYRQLEPDLRRAYRLLGLHPGTGFDETAVAALAGATPAQAQRVIDQLLDTHLLLEPVPGRYQFHDLTREHAATRAAHDETERDRDGALAALHRHYARCASSAMDVAYPFERERRPGPPPGDTPVPDLLDPAQGTRWLDAEMPNLLAAARHAADHGWPEHALHLSVVLHRHLRTRGAYVDAEALHERALTVAREIGDRGGEAEALVALAHLNRLRGRLGPAECGYRDALNAARGSGNRVCELDALTYLGHVAMAQSRYAAAAEYFDEAGRIARAAGNGAFELEALSGLGWVRLALGQDATAVFVRALDAARALDHHIGEMHILRALGHVHRGQGRWDEAIDHFEQTLSMARRAGSRNAELSALVGLGWVHRRDGQLDPAADCYHLVLDLAREIGSREYEFEAFQGMGRVHLAAGRTDQAVASHRAALRLVGDRGPSAEHARVYDGLAHVARASGRPEEARRLWERVLAILAELGVDHIEDDDVTGADVRVQLASLDRRA